MCAVTGGIFSQYISHLKKSRKLGEKQSGKITRIGAIIDRSILKSQKNKYTDSFLLLQITKEIQKCINLLSTTK